MFSSDLRVHELNGQQVFYNILNNTFCVEIIIGQSRFFQIRFIQKKNQKK